MAYWPLLISILILSISLNTCPGYRLGHRRDMGLSPGVACRRLRTCEDCVNRRNCFWSKERLFPCRAEGDMDSVAFRSCETARRYGVTLTDYPSEAYLNLLLALEKQHHGEENELY